MIHHIGIIVDDLGSAEQFAISVLGLRVTKRASLPEQATELVFLACGSAEIELIEISDPQKRRARAELSIGAATIEHIAVAVDDVERAADEWASAGVRLRAGAHQNQRAANPSRSRAPGAFSRFQAPPQESAGS